MIRNTLFTAALWAAACLAHGQAKIVESRPMGDSRYSGSSSEQSGGDNSVQNELYYKLQVLEQEVQQLRGIVEEQSYELKRLKQQRLDDYLDLDRRISQGGPSAKQQTSVRTPTGQSQVRMTNTPTTPTQVAGSKVKELEVYHAAINLAIKERDFDGAIKALNKYLEDFPQGSYVGHSQYWLGQIYFQKKDMQNSKVWFGKLIESHPKHRKTPEAKFKLGKVLFSLGNKAEAKQYLQEVAAGDSSAAKLANDFLAQNFSQ